MIEIAESKSKKPDRKVWPFYCFQSLLQDRMFAQGFLVPHSQVPLCAGFSVPQDGQVQDAPAEML